jgi:hypothetical protein
VKLNDVNIPKGFDGPAFSQSFIVSNRGTLKIKVGIMVKSLLGAGQSVYVAELMRTSNTIVLASQEYFVITNRGGKMLITSTWTSICGVDPAGCRLTFRLLRNGTAMASSIGYSHNALFGNASPRMTINYTVPANQVSGTWSLRVEGASLGSASNVKPTVKFTPVCQN